MADHDWGLQAVIRSKEHDNDHDHDHQQYQHDYNQDELFGSIDMKKEYDQALIFCYPHLFDHNHHHEYDHGGATTSSTIVATDELDQLYKPFYHVPAAADQEIQQVHQEHVIKKICGSALNTSKLAPKLKKRKNQQKRVVEVTADGLSADPWAWRKYGQKPIKGSIYPRSYYRCSSSKGCMARRQVEQNYTDSSIYILTYTAEHNHPQPTRRNSLAGINRGRFKATLKSPTTSDNGKTVTKLAKDSPFHSPTTLSISSIEDEVLEQLNVKQLDSEETLFYKKFDDQGHSMMPGVNDDDYMVFSDDFFEGLDDLGGYKMDSSSCKSSTNQFSHVFC